MESYKSIFINIALRITIKKNHILRKIKYKL
jgi:hypothetical protein